MGKLRTALTFAMRAGKPLRKAADIVKLGRTFQTPVGRQAVGAADDIASRLPVRSGGGLMRSGGGGGMVPTGGSSMVGSRGGAMMRQGSGTMVQQGGGAMVQQGGAMVRQGSGAMTPYNPGGPLQRSSRFIPPVGLVPMFTNPPAPQPMVEPSDIWDVPDPAMVPRDPIMPDMTPGFTPADPGALPPPMMPRSPVPVSMPEMPMTMPPMMDLPDVAPMRSPRTPTMPDITMPDMSMGPPDITMPGFEVAFDDVDPTPGPMNIQEPDIDYGFLDSINRLPAPMYPPRRYVNPTYPGMDYSERMQQFIPPHSR